MDMSRRPLSAQHLHRLEQIPARARTTGRLRAHMGTAIGDAARAVAATFSVAWPTAHRTFAAYADARLTELTPVRALRIDETRHDKPMIQTVKRLACGFVIARTRLGGYAFTAPVNSGLGKPETKTI